MTNAMVTDVIDKPGIAGVFYARSLSPGQVARLNGADVATSRLSEFCLCWGQGTHGTLGLALEVYPKYLLQRYIVCGVGLISR